MSRHQVAIIGGGISGLASAFYLGRLGVRSILVERSNRLGGLIRTDLEQGCRFEAGPDSYIATKTAVSALASELGLTEQIIGSNDAARRVFIVRKGGLVPLPSGMSMMVPGKLLPALRSPLFGPATKIRFLRERFARPRKREADFSVGELVQDHFGSEVLEYVADPLLAGVYGGNAAQLSAPSVLPRFAEYEQRYGSLLKGVRKEATSQHAGSLFLSFRDGMQTLTDALSLAIADHTSVRHEEAVSIGKADGGWVVRLTAGDVHVDTLVLACPARTCAHLLASAAPELASELREIPYSSALLVTLVFDASELRRPLDGFGFLVPEVERKTIAACTWINTKYPSRITAGLVALRAFIVAAQATRVETLSDNETAQLALQDLERFMGFRASPRIARVHRWPRSMPQYVVGHAARVQRIRQLLRSQPNLQLVGNAYDGVGVPDCVRLARETAAVIAVRLKACNQPI